MRKRLVRFAVLELAVMLAIMTWGCASATYKAHPGSVNNFDSQTYDALLVAHSVIEQTKTDLAGGVFPASIASNIKSALNSLILAYNVADTSYQVYHAAAVAGTATQAQIDAVSATQSTLSSNLTQLSTAKAGS